MKRFVRDLVSGHPLEPAARRVHALVTGRADIYYALYNVYLTRSLSSGGEYHVDLPQGVEFTLKLPTLTWQKHKRVAGRWEPAVMDALLEKVEEGATFWEVGAAYGYFSMAVAATVARVVAFETDPDRADLIRESASINGFDNVDVVRGEVGREVHLDSFEPPDVVLMDVEGWEYEILQDSPDTLRARPVWLIEVHAEPGLGVGDDLNVNPEGVRELLRDHGYSLSTLDFGNEPYHLMAVPDPGR